MEKYDSKKKFRAALLITLIFSILFSMETLAYTKKVRTMKQTTTTNVNTGTSGVIVFYDNVNWKSKNIEAYHKITVPKTGRLEICLGNGTVTKKLKVCLCDNKYRTVETDSTGNSVSTQDVHVLGVTKGTYYLRIKGAPQYFVLASFVPQKDVGTTKAKATRVSRTSKDTTAVFASGERPSKCNWYKINITKKQKIKLSFSAAGKGSLTFYLYNSKGKKLFSKKLALKGSRRIYTGGKAGDYAYYYLDSIQKTITLSKGIYYIKVTRTSGNKYKRTSASTWFHYM